MEADKEFDAVSHPIRIKILEMLADKPMSFAELKRKLDIRSSGKLDFHLKKLDGLITIDENGKYVITKEGQAALQAVITIRKYGWQKRAYFITTILYIIFTAYLIWIIIRYPDNLIYILTLALITLWYLFYSYWNIIKRKIFHLY
jgi:DNA-binding HxlR family transcriptional regulator